jgi:DNA repair exonuclease SbcCD ATPase subunit
MRVSRKARTQTQTKKGRLQTMARRSNKTPQEIAAELQRQADAAKARAALAEVSDNPILAPLQKELDTINRNIAGYSRKISGPQSFANRIEAARLRMAWIEAEQDSVTAANKIANAQREYLQQQINSVAQDIANGDADVRHGGSGCGVATVCQGCEERNDEPRRCGGRRGGLTIRPQGVYGNP